MEWRLARLALTRQQRATAAELLPEAAVHPSTPTPTAAALQLPLALATPEAALATTLLQQTEESFMAWAAGALAFETMC